METKLTIEKQDLNASPINEDHSLFFGKVFRGKSAYQYAVESGLFSGTEEEFKSYVGNIGNLSEASKQATQAAVQAKNNADTATENANNAAARAVEIATTKGSEAVNIANQAAIGVSEMLYKATTYSELRTLKQNGKLEAGAFYRITDYECRTSQTDTRSAGHTFDIIVQALDERTLSENAQAIQHDGDTYFSNSNLKAWQMWYDFDNTKRRFNWATPWVDEKPAKWSCGAGLIEERYDSGASTAYTTALVDGRTRYLYRPPQLAEYLADKELWERQVISSITSPNGFIYEADSAPENYGDEEYEDWYWDDMGDIRVKTADGRVVAVLSHSGGGAFYDQDYDEYGMYYIEFEPNAEWDEENEVYIFTPSYGIEDWWDSVRGGSISEYDKLPYTGPKDNLYYSLDTILSKSSKQVTSIYSPDTGKEYMYGDDVYSPSSIDTISYSSYTAFKEGDKGVIYRLIDDKGNDFPYDYKNIQFKHEGEWYYTFGVSDNSVSKKTVFNNVSTWGVDDGGTNYLTFAIFKNAKTYRNNISVADKAGKMVFDAECYLNTIRLEEVGEIIMSDAMLGTTIAGYTVSLEGKMIVDSEIVIWGGFIDLTAANFLNGHIETSSNNTLKVVADRLNNVKIYGSGTFKVIDGSGNNKYLTGSDIHLGRSGSNVSLSYSGTTSANNRVEGVYLRIPNGGSKEYTIDISDFPTNANYTLNIATDSQGNVKKWCEADLIQ